MWYSQLPPGWAASGSAPSRDRNSSGVSCGGSGPGPMPAAYTAWSSGEPSHRPPKPRVLVSRWRTVMGRSAGTVSASGPVRLTSTRGSASSGSHRATGSSRSSTPSSASDRVSTPAYGLDTDASRNSESGRTGAVPPSSRHPPVCTSTSPRYRTADAKPGSRPRATSPCSIDQTVTNRERCDMSGPPAGDGVQRSRPRRSGELIGSGGGRLGPEPPLEAGRDDQVIGRELVDRRVAQADQRRSQPVAEQVEHVLHAGLPVGGQSPQVG